MSRKPRVAVGVVVGTAVGFTTGWLDSSPHWDDTGVTAGTVLLAAAALAYWQRRCPWLWALIVGVWVPVLALARNGDKGAFAALIFAAIGAGAGHLAARRR